MLHEPTNIQMKVRRVIRCRMSMAGVCMKESPVPYIVIDSKHATRRLEVSIRVNVDYYIINFYQTNNRVLLR